MTFITHQAYSNCLWSINDKAKTRFGYAINNFDLPITNDLMAELDNLEALYT